VVPARSPRNGQASHSLAVLHESRRVGEGGSRATGGASLCEVLGPSTCPHMGYSGSSTKNKETYFSGHPRSDFTSHETIIC
jgi:hypothetical protein